jgi:hypothetical protein
MRRALLCTLAALAVAAIAWPAGTAAASAIQEVFVTNWPRVQEVTGRLAIDGTVRLSTTEAKRDLIVSPAGRDDTTQWIEAGTLDTGGFGHVTLSLVGATKGEVGRTGTVGAILLPDVEFVLEAFHDRGETLFALEVAADGVGPATPFFASRQPRYPVGFSRYRVYLFNTTDKSTDVELHAHLSP